MTDTTARMDKDAIMAMMQGYPVEFNRVFLGACLFNAPWGRVWVTYPNYDGTCTLSAFFEDGGQYIRPYVPFDKDTITNFLVKAELGARNDENK